jgi:hypothetical protein
MPRLPPRPGIFIRRAEAMLNFAITEFSEVRQDSSPLASVRVLCNTAAELRVVSPLNVRSREKIVKTITLGALATAAGALVAVGLLMLMLLMSETHPAGAILLPGLRGKIAYQGYDGHDWEIYKINAAGGGGGEVRLTHNSTNDAGPSWGNRR